MNSTVYPYYIDEETDVAKWNLLKYQNWDLNPGNVAARPLLLPNIRRYLQEASVYLFSPGQG